MDALVQKVVQQITAAVHPDKIILFGSRAGGTGHADSDIDLVVLYSGPKPKREIQIGIRRLFEHPDFSMDLFVMTPQEFEAQKSVANTLAREAAEKGVVCYG